MWVNQHHSLTWDFPKFALKKSHVAGQKSLSSHFQDQGRNDFTCQGPPIRGLWEFLLGGFP